MADLAYKRADRVSHLIQQELGQLLVNGVKDLRIGFVTVTEVRLTDDLRSARVYISIFGDESERASSLSGLQDAAGYLKRELSQRIRLRYTPNLTFHHDTTLDRAARLEELLASTRKNDAIDSAESDEDAIVRAETSRSALAARRDSFVVEEKPPKKRQRRRSGRRRN